MNDCPDGAVRDQLPDLVNDRLGPDARRRVNAHLGECADCRHEVELLRAMRSSLRRGPVVDAGAIASAIPAYRAPRRAWVGWRAAAAMLLVAVGGTSVAVLHRDNGRDAGTPVAATAQRGGSPAEQPGPSTNPAAIEEPARDLALGNPAIDELDDRELSSLLDGLETLEALPFPDEDRSADVTMRDLAGTD